MPQIRIPATATPELRDVVRQIQTVLDRLISERNVDYHGRRVINAGDAVDDQDYVTLVQMNRVIEERIEEVDGGTAGPIQIPGLPIGSVVFVGEGGMLSGDEVHFYWDPNSLQLIVEAEIHGAVWRGEIIDVNFGGTGLNGGVSGGILAFTAPAVLQSSAELGAGLLIIGGGAGSVPSTDALQGVDPTTPPDGSVWAVETSPTTFEIRARMGGVTQSLGGGGGGGITELTGDVTAGPGSGSQAATIANNAVTDAKLRDSAALSVIGRSANSSGDPADIAAASDGQVLRRSGTAVGFGAVNLASANAVTGVLPAANLPASYYPIKFSVDGGGDPIATGVKKYTALIITEGDGNIISWDLRSDVSATLTVNVRKNGSSITNGNNPALSAATQASDVDLSDWSSVAVAAGDVITINVTANDNSEFFELTMTVQRT